VQVPAVQVAPPPQGLSQAPQCDKLVFVSTHRLPHAVCPSAQAHSPPSHDCPAAQAWSHTPQWVTLVLASTQLAPHCSNAASQLLLHIPSEQTCPSGHALPQVPQLAPSSKRFVQPLGQESSPAWHVQVPATQLEPVPHELPQLPQFSMSV
jgi:hypothetical protein